MKLILTEDFSGLGTVGDIVSIKDGYARNYLLPRALGVVADAGNTRELDHRKRVLAKKKTRILNQAKETAAKLAKLTLVVQTTLPFLILQNLQAGFQKQPSFPRS